MMDAGFKKPRAQRCATLLVARGIFLLQFELMGPREIADLRVFSQPEIQLLQQQLVCEFLLQVSAHYPPERGVRCHSTATRR